MTFVRDTSPSTTTPVVDRTDQEKMGIWIVESNSFTHPDGKPYRYVVAYDPESDNWVNVRDGWPVQPSRFIKRVTHLAM